MHGTHIKIKNSLITFCRPIIIRLLNCNTESKQVTEGRKYLPRGPHVGQPWNKQTIPERLEKSFGKITISTLGIPTPIERIRGYRTPEWANEDRLWICSNRPYWPNTTTKLEFCLQGAESACHFVLDRYFKRTDTQHLFVCLRPGRSWWASCSCPSTWCETVGCIFTSTILLRSSSITSPWASLWSWLPSTCLSVLLTLDWDAYWTPPLRLTPRQKNK